MWVLWWVQPGVGVAVVLVSSTGPQVSSGDCGSNVSSILASVEKVFVPTWHVESETGEVRAGSQVRWILSREVNVDWFWRTYGSTADQITSARVPEVDGTADRVPVTGQVVAVDELWCQYAPGPDRAPTPGRQPIWEPVAGSGRLIGAGTASIQAADGFELEGLLVTIEVLA